MLHVDFVAYFIMQCVSIINNDIIILHPVFLANIFIYLHDNEYFQRIILLLRQILFAFMLFLVIIGSISYGFIRRKQIHVQDAIPAQCKSESFDVIEQEQKLTTVSPVSEISTSNQNDDYCDLLLKIPIILSNDFSLDEKLATSSLREITCYCDGSYSHTTGIGYSGFRASNGYSRYRPCSLRHPRDGSTESEVFAACLALRYTAKYHYDTLILYTDNSKVEQLSKRLKPEDYKVYPRFFKALKQCHKGKEHFHIRVEHVPGHTTWYEQQQCLTKREFAIVDRQVRRKRQQHERKYGFAYRINYPFYTTCSYRCSRRYVRFIHP